MANPRPPLPAALLTLCALALAAGGGGRVTGGATWAGTRDRPRFGGRHLEV